MAPNSPTPETTSPLTSVSLLSDHSRWRMFSYIRRSRRAVTRDEVFASVGISRKLAAFHLDKLVDAGLLQARYEAPAGNVRAGRRPKVYEPTDVQVLVSIPGRRHGLLADLLLESVLTEGDGERAADAAVRTARQRGRDLGAAERDRSRPGRLGVERGLTMCEPMLEEHGYEPVREGSQDLRLLNCPFHPYAARAPALVCGMNQAFLSGYLEALGVSHVEAVLAPIPGECCVRLTGTGS